MTKKRRTEFRKNHQGKIRTGDLTRQYNSGDAASMEDAELSERVSGKGDLTRHRTIIEPPDNPNLPEGDDSFVRGRVLSIHGLQSNVMGDDATLYTCATRQLLKSVSTDQRHVVAVGDHVWLRRAGHGQGMIERVEPRSRVLCRTSRGRQHVIVSNVDWLLIVTSLAEPNLKPGLVDRFLLTAEHFGIQPIICINKTDLADLSSVQSLIGTYAQLGYRVLACSATEGIGMSFLKRLLRGKETAVVGQSGVGKSSLLNAIEPGLQLKVSAISTDNQKGRHTTTAARLIPLSTSGFIIDTPGIRQFQLWDIASNEIAGLMPDFRPYVSHCRYPDCLHINEDMCRVKDAVADGQIDARRYDSYCGLIEDDLASSLN